MIFAHADHSIALAINHPVGVTHFGFRRDRLRLRAFNEMIQTLIGEVRKIDHAIAHSKAPAAIFVNASAGVERRRGAINSPPIRRQLDNNIAAFLLWPAFHPINVFAVYRDLPQTDRAGNDGIGSNGRFPGTVTSDLHFKHQPLPPSQACMFISGFDRELCAILRSPQFASPLVLPACEFRSVYLPPQFRR